MHSNKGYLLLGFLLFFSLLALSSSIAVFEQDTRLKRFREQDLKLNLDHFRRAVDLYTYTYTVTAPNPTKISLLQTALQGGNASEVVTLLAQENFLRSRIATGSHLWKLVTNLVKNPSFEADDAQDFGFVGTWRGNFTANDLVPNGWNLIPTGIEQCINLSAPGYPATFVVSLWGRGATAAAGAKLRIWPSPETLPLAEVTINGADWKRGYGPFAIPAPLMVRLEITRTSNNSGDHAYLDGVMLELWTPPTNAPAGLQPAPSAWTAGTLVASDLSSDTLQTRIFQTIIGTDTNPSSFSTWLSW
jgi:hypothetical protein